MLVAICTRQRPSELGRLLQSIRDMDPPEDHRLEVLIVENDVALSIEKIVSGANLSYPVHTVLESHLGLVHVRNRTLDFAEALNADYLLGVDDDEWVDRDWVRAYERAIKKLPHIACFIGPCHYVYGGDLSAWRSQYQLRFRFLGQQPPVRSTANYLISARIFSRSVGLGQRFDARYSDIGGEDGDFFLRLQRLHSEALASVPQAISFEDVKGERATFAYYFRRKRREIATWHYIKYRVSRQAGGSAVKSYQLAWRHTVFSLFFFFSKLANGLWHSIRSGRLLKDEIGMAAIHLAQVLSFFDFVFGRQEHHYAPTSVSTSVKPEKPSSLNDCS